LSNLSGYRDAPRSALQRPMNLPSAEEINRRTAIAGGTDAGAHDSRTHQAGHPPALPTVRGPGRLEARDLPATIDDQHRRAIRQAVDQARRLFRAAVTVTFFIRAPYQGSNGAATP
jgi:hypothetical protein